MSEDQGQGVYFLTLIWMGERENDSGSHCNSSWKLGPLIGIYTTPCCRALFYLDPVASFFGKLKASFSSAGFSGSPLWPFALFECCVFLLPEGSNVSIPVFPIACSVGLHYWWTSHKLGRSHHSRLRWASSCLNRSIQVSWIVSWKAYRRRGVPVFIWKLYD